MSKDPWVQNQAGLGVVIAIDLIGFSLSGNEEQLVTARNTLVRAIEKTPPFSTALKECTVWPHFLGDEVRLAFREGLMTSDQACDFSFEVLRKISQAELVDKVYARAYVTSGQVVPCEWRRCRYIDGQAVSFLSAGKGAPKLKTAAVALRDDSGNWSTDKVQP